MEDLKFTAKFGPKDYMQLTVRNSAFDDIQDISAEILFSLNIEQLTDGIIIKFTRLESIKLNYEGYFDEQDTWTPVEDNINEETLEKEWQLKTYMSNREIDSVPRLEMSLSEVYIDVIKKTIDLTF